MKGKTLQLVLTIFLLLGISLTQAFAQEPEASKQQTIKGQWTFHTQAASRILDIHAFFKNNNKGFIIGGDEGTLPLLYNQKNNLVNITFDTPWLFDYPNVTIVFRGTLSDNNTINGTATVVTNQIDPSSLNGFVIFTVPITGQREPTLTNSR